MHEDGIVVLLIQRAFGFEDFGVLLDYIVEQLFQWLKVSKVVSARSCDYSVSVLERVRPTAFIDSGAFWVICRWGAIPYSFALPPFLGGRPRISWWAPSDG